MSEMKQFKVEYYGRVFVTEVIEAANAEEAWRMAEVTMPDYVDQANILWEVIDVEEEEELK